MGDVRDILQLKRPARATQARAPTSSVPPLAPTYKSRSGDFRKSSKQSDKVSFTTLPVCLSCPIAGCLSGMILYLDKSNQFI